MNNVRDGCDRMAIKTVNPMSWLEIAWNGFVNAIVEVCSDALPEYHVDYRGDDERAYKRRNHFVGWLQGLTHKR